MLEAAGRDDVCVPGGAVVDGDIRSGGVRRPRCIGLVRPSGGNTVILFCMHARTKGEEYSAGGDVLWRRWKKKGKLAQIVRKCNE